MVAGDKPGRLRRGGCCGRGAGRGAAGRMRQHRGYRLAGCGSKRPVIPQQRPAERSLRTPPTAMTIGRTAAQIGGSGTRALPPLRMATEAVTPECRRSVA